MANERETELEVFFGVTAKMSNPLWAWNVPSGDAENQFRLQVFNKVKIMSQATAAATTTTSRRNNNNNENAGLPLSLPDKTS